MAIVLDTETYLQGKLDLHEVYKTLGPGNEFQRELAEHFKTYVYAVGVLDLEHKEYKYFTDILEFYDWIKYWAKARNKNIHIYGHNIYYDIKAIENTLLKAGVGEKEIGLDCKFTTDKSSLQGGVFYLDQEKTLICKLHDSMMYINEALSKEDSDCIEYAKTDVVWDKRDNGWWYINWQTGKKEFEDYSKCIKYLENDIYKTAKIIKEQQRYLEFLTTLCPPLQERLDDSYTYGLTSVTEALRIIFAYYQLDKKRNKELKTCFYRLFQPDINTARYELEALSNFGGFQLYNTKLERVYQKGHIHKIDINSAYGEAFKEGIPFKRKLKKLELNNELEAILGKPVEKETCKFYRVKFRGLEIKDPAFKDTNGQFLRANLTNKKYSNGGYDELLLLDVFYEALKKVVVFKDLEIIEIEEYEKTNNLYPIIQDLYKFRKGVTNDNPELKNIAKSAILRSYGSLAQRAYRTQKTRRKDDEGKYGYVLEPKFNSNYSDHSVIGGVYVVQFTGARLLNDIINLSKCPGFKLLSCHTDSITFICNGSDWKKKISISDEMGDWKIEIEGADHYLSSGFNKYLIYKNESEFKYGFSANIKERWVRSFVKQASKEDLFTFFDPNNNVRVEMTNRTYGKDKCGINLGRTFGYTIDSTTPVTHEALYGSFKLEEIWE